MVFKINVSRGSFVGDFKIKIEGPVWTNKLDMSREEWDAFQSLLQPSPKADFELIQEEPSDTSNLR